MRGRAMAVLVVAVVGVCGSAVAGPAKTYWWDGGGTDNNWSTPENWSSDVVPASADTVIFDSDGNSRPCVVDVDVTVADLEISVNNIGEYTQTITVPSGATLATTDAFFLASNMVVNGTLHIHSADYWNNVTTNSTTGSQGNLVFNYGSTLSMEDDDYFKVDADASLTMAGISHTDGESVIVTASGGALGQLHLLGNISLNYVEFHDLAECPDPGSGWVTGLKLGSATGQTVAASNCTFTDFHSLGGAGNHYLYIEGSAWAGYTFGGFSFQDGTGTTDPEFAVEYAIESSTIWFVDYATGNDKLFGDSPPLNGTDTSSKGTVIWEKDLEVTSIVPSNSNPAQGDTISILVTVTNNGHSAASGFRVDLFLHEGSKPSGTDQSSRYQTITTPLAAGASTVVTFTGVTYGAVSPATPTWNTYANVDSALAVTESDETNNVTGPTLIVWGAAGIPDLTITDITPSSATPQVGGTITVEVDVANTGTGAVGSFSVDLFYDRDVPPAVGQSGNQTTTVSGLAAGGTDTVTFTGVTSADPADWTMYAIVDTVQTVAESDESDNVFGPSAVQWQGVDLRVESVTPSATESVIGTPIQFEVEVKNYGNVAAGAFDVGLYHDRATAPAPGAGADATESVSSLGAGATTTVTFTGVDSAVADVWSSYVVVDDTASPGAVTEYNESNNVSGPTSITWRAPDLVVLSVTPSTVMPIVDVTALSVTLVVKNQGDADAGAFSVGLYHNESSAPTPGDGADDTQAVAAGLAAGAQTPLTFTGITNVTVGIWQIYAIVDDVAAGGDVQEDDETNNVRGPTAVSWIPGTPDLLVASVNPSDADPAIGDTVTVTVTVQNDGTGDAGTSAVGLFKNPGAEPTPGDAADQTKSVGVVAKQGGTRQCQFDVTSTAIGAWTTYAVADNGLAIGESSEDNNVSTGTTITWHAPQLQIMSISPVPATQDAGGTVDVTVHIRNDGDATATGFDVGLFYDLAAAPSVGDTADLTETVPSLAAATETDVVFSGVTCATYATWSMYAIIDNGEAVLESNETDNVAGPQTVTWQGTDLRIVSVTPSNSSPTASTSITVTVIVRNYGNLAAGGFDVGLYRNEPSAPSPGDAGTNGKETPQSVASLAPGAQTPVVFSGVTNAAVATWQMYAVVDDVAAGGDVAETDETNNVAGPVTIEWTAGTPDLLVESVSPSDTDPSIGDTVTLTVTVRNDGTGTAGSSDVGLFEDPGAAPTPGDTADQTESIGSVTSSGGTTECYLDVTSDVPGAWTSYVVADNGLGLTETNEGNNVSSGTTITWRAPQLQIMSISPVPATQDAGGTVDVTVHIRNDGDATATGFDVGIFYDLAAAPSVGDTADLTETVTSLAAATETDVVFSGVTYDTYATWAMYAIIDNGEAVLESNETDNVAGPQTVTWQGTDLRIVSVTPSTTTPVAGVTSLSVTVVVSNDGNFDAGAFEVGLYYNEAAAPSPGDAGTNGKATPESVASLAAGATTPVVLSGITNATAEAWQMYVVVDDKVSGGDVTETDETNNVDGPTAVTWSAGVPDLVIDSVGLSATDPSIGDSVTVTVTVRNDGPVDAGAFSVGLYQNPGSAPLPGGTADLTEPITLVTAGGTAQCTFDVTSDTVGAWTMYAVADNGLALAESDENNNVSTGTAITWRAPQLQILSVTPTTATPNAGDTIDVTVRVRNDGDADAGAFVVALFYDAVSAPDISDRADETQSVTWLAAATETDVVFTGITHDTYATWSMYAAMDKGESIQESDETDNVSDPATVVTWRGTDLVILSVTPSDPNPIAGVTTLSVTVVVRNEGNLDAGAFEVGLYCDEAAAPAPGDAGTNGKATPESVASLAAETETNVVFSGITNVAQESWDMYAVVDDNGAGGDVAETDETNNVAGPETVAWSAELIDVLTPDGGEIWQSNSVQQITWQSLPGVGSFVAIEYTTDGSNWTEIAASTLNDGEFAWRIPVVAAIQSTCRVRVVEIGGAGSSAESEADFSLVPESLHLPDLVIAALIPAQSVGQPGTSVAFDVVLRNVGNEKAQLVAIDLYWTELPGPGATSDLDGQIASIEAGQEVSLSLSLTSPVDDVWQVYAVVDAGTAIAELNEDNNVAGPVEVVWGLGNLVELDSFDITAPNGGEELSQGETCTVTWDQNGFAAGDLAYIEASADGGVTWSEVASGIEATAGTYDWTVDATASEECRLRISDYRGMVTDTSDEVFTITPEGADAAPYVGQGCAPSRNGAALAMILVLMLPMTLRKRRTLATKRVGP